MAIATTILRRSVFGNMRIVAGYSVISGGTNTGDVVTGLNSVEIFLPVTYGSAQKGLAVNETLPCTGDVTIVSESNDATIQWLAIGK